MEHQLELANESVGKLLLKYSIPAIIGMLVNALYNVVDRMFIGHIPGIGNLAITGVGITMPLITIILGFAMLVGIGATAAISLKLGQGRKQDAEQILGNASVVAVVMGIVLMIISLVFSGRLLMLFGGTEETLPYGTTYINVFLLGTVFNILGFTFTSIMRADGNPKMSAALMALGCILNIILDAVFIFILNMGIMGAAWATIISQCFTAVMGIWFFTKGKSNLKIKKENFKIKSEIVKEMMVIGAAPCAMQLAVSLVQVVMNNVLKQTGGSDAIGAFTAISSICLIVLMPIFGINQGSQPVIGYNYGAKAYQRSKKASILSMAAATVILIAGFIMIQLMPGVFVRMFDGEGAIMEVAEPGLRLYTLTLPILALPIIGSNYFQAIGKAKMATLLSLLRQVIILIPVIIIASKIGGLKGAWLAQPISDLISSTIVCILLIREFKSYNHK